jgi:hypothetical protein
MHRAFPERFATSATLEALAASGRRSVYDAERGAPHIDPEVAALVPSASAGVPDADAVRQRVLRALAEEIGIMLDEGVVGAAADIDLCMVLGAGWPFWLGGITPYLDRTGTSTAVRHRTFHSGPPSATD